MKLAALEMKVEAQLIKFEAYNLILGLTQVEQTNDTVVSRPPLRIEPKKRGRKKGSKNRITGKVKRREVKYVVKELQAVDTERQKHLNAVLSHLSQLGKATLNGIHQGIGGKKSTVLNSIAQLKKEKRIVFESTPKPGYYSLAENH